ATSATTTQARTAKERRSHGDDGIGAGSVAFGAGLTVRVSAISEHLLEVRNQPGALDLFQRELDPVALLTVLGDGVARVHVGGDERHGLAVSEGEDAGAAVGHLPGGDGLQAGEDGLERP